MGRFDNKVAVITGSTMGIGYSIAERLGSEGCAVIVSSRKQTNIDKALKQLKESVPGIRVFGKPCHTGKVADIKALIEFTVSQCGRIDFVIPNAASNVHFGTFMSATEAQWDKILSTNLKGPFLLVKHALPYLKKSKGCVVNVASIGAYNPVPFIGVYNISKTALLGLTRCMAEELASFGIRVNAIAPGLIPTKFSSALVSNDMAKQSTISTTLMKRLGTVEECSGTVAFLCSKDASYITGECIVMAGGQRSRL